MNTIKKIMALLLAVAMIATVFAGCQTEKPVETSAPTENQNVEVGNDETEEPTRGEPVTLKWIFMGTESEGTASAVAAANELLLERYNLQLEATLVDSGNYSEKMTMMMQGGDDWDLCFTTGGWLNVYSKAIEMGGFLDLTPYIEADPELVGDNPDYFMESIKYSDGKIYAIPNYQIAVSCNGLSFQAALVDEYNEAGGNLNVYDVQHPDDAIPFMEWIQENHPEIYPASWSVPIAIDNQLSIENNWWGISDYTAIPDGDGWKLVWNNSYFSKEDQLKYEVGGWWSGVTYREWWENGYLRPDIPTVINDNTEVNNNFYAIVGEVQKPGIEGEKLRNTGIPYYCVTTNTPTYAGGAINAMNAVNSMSKHPDEAVQMLKIINNDADIFNILCYGVEGEHYHLEDGKVAVDVATGLAAWSMGNQANAYLTVGQADNTNEQLLELNGSGVTSPLLGFSPNKEPVAEVVAAISAKAAEYDKWQYEDNWEELYDEMVEVLAPLHEQVIAEYQKQLDAWWAENGK